MARIPGALAWWRNSVLASAVLVSCCAHVVTGQEQAKQPEKPADAPAAPLIRIKPYQVNIGALEPRQKREAQVVIRNDGEAPAVLRKVSTSCTCTAVNFKAPITIAPNGEFVLQVRVKGRNTVGPLHTQANLFFEHRAEPYVVKVEGKVSRAISATPSIIDVLVFAGRNPEPSMTGDITLKSEDGLSFRVLSVQGKPVADSKPATTHTVQYNFEGVEQKDMPIWFVIETDHPKAPLVELRVGSLALLDTGQGSGPWDPDLDILLLGKTAPGTPVQQDMELAGLRDTTVKATFNTANGNFDVHIDSERMGARGRVFTLTFTPALGVEGFVHDKLVIDAKGHERSIDLYASVRK